MTACRISTEFKLSRELFILEPGSKERKYATDPSETE